MPTIRRPGPAKQRAAREARRLQAAELFALSRSQAEVARDRTARPTIGSPSPRDPKIDNNTRIS